MVAQGPQQRHAQTLLMRAAIRRGNGVAVGRAEPVLAGGEPGHGPFQRAVAIATGLAGEDAIGNRVLALDVAGEIVAQAA